MSITQILPSHLISAVEARILDTATTFIKNLYITALLGEGISWNTEGNAIILTDNDEILLKVIKKYYNQTKITSFVRQLNFYGFKKDMIINASTKVM